MHVVSDAEALDLPIHATLAGKHVLVTGVTGFVGKVWLTMLLDQVPDIGRVSVLIRKAGRRKPALKRFETIANTSPAFRPLRERHGDDFAAWLAARVEVIEGDVKKPLCGLDTDTISALARGPVDVVVHFAGSTDFMGDPIDALGINTQGANHIADLAVRVAGGRLVHCSTTFVVGRTSGQMAESVTTGVSPLGLEFDAAAEVEACLAACAEADAPFENKRDKGAARARSDAAAVRAEALGWPNIYTYTKGLAEHLLTARDDLDLTIVRPSIVECAESYPLRGWNEGVNTTAPLFWLLSTPFRDFPANPKNHFDVVPVDMAAKGMTLVVAAALRGEAGGVYHLATGDVNEFTFERGTELTALYVRRHHNRTESKPVERMLLRHLDARPRQQSGLTSITSLRKAARGIGRFLGSLDGQRLVPAQLRPMLGEQVEMGLYIASKSAKDVDKQLARIDKMLELFKPFIYDHDWEFSTERVRSLARRLTDTERTAWDFDPTTIDWREYWLEVEGPGLNQWSIPLIRGEEIPQDPASSPPLSLAPPAAESLPRAAGR